MNLELTLAGNNMVTAQRGGRNSMAVFCGGP
jgi:hypothetical protein